MSGTSQGIISRSFLSYLKKSFPKSNIDLVYIHPHDSKNDELNRLPVNEITDVKYNLKPNLFVKWINRISIRISNFSFYENVILNQFRQVIKTIDYSNYDVIFIRSSGFNCLSILSIYKLPIITKSIIFFNEPFPLHWSPGKLRPLGKFDLIKLKKMKNIVSRVRACVATEYLARDLQFLYGSNVRFFSVPHVFDPDVFALNQDNNPSGKSEVVTFGYHGSTQYGRNIFIVLDAYVDLLKNFKSFSKNTRFILRIKCDFLDDLRAKYRNYEQIEFLPFVPAAQSIKEQLFDIDINVLMENGPIYSSSLLGKAPVAAYSGKPILCITPLRSEIKEKVMADFVCGYNELEIRQRMRLIIENYLINEREPRPFGDYFSHSSFDAKLHEIIEKSS